MRIDAGKQEAEVLPNTEYLGTLAMEQLQGQIQDLVGRRFFGESRVTLIWVAGQITEARPMVEGKYR